MYRKRFALINHPLPKDAQAKTFFEHLPGYDKLARAFKRLVDEPGLGLLTGEPGVGKTAAIRNLCYQLPKPDYLVIYLCDTAVSPLDLYRTLAIEMGVTASHRRAQLWTDIKKSLAHMRDEQGIRVVLVVDEAQHLSDRFLIDLSGFVNFAFDSRDLLTLWLVGLSGLTRTLRMQQHAPLAMRVAAQVHLEAIGDRKLFSAMLEHALKAAGSNEKLLSDPALELLFRGSRGVPRVASKLLTAALRLAHEREHGFVDDSIMEQALDEMTALHPGAV